VTAATVNVLAPSCASCGSTLLAPEFLNSPQPIGCPRCGVLQQILVFPAFFRPIASGRKPEELLLEGESSCFFHPQKKAVVPCGHCGRFLCSLCDVDFGGQHLCPTCLELGQEKRTLKTLENHRVRYDTLALAVALLPLLLWPFTCLTAPAALYMAVRYWNSPGSIVGSSKFRFILAIFFALAQIAAWVVALYFVFTS
jgi:hypothetical protein